MRALRWGVLGAAWIGLACWTWLTFTPLPPAWTLQIPSGQMLLGTTMDGEFALAHGGQFEMRGPVTFINGRDGRVDREMLTAEDRFPSPYNRVSNGMAVLRDGRLLVVDERTGDVRGELPLDNHLAWAWPLEDRRRFLYLDGSTLRMRDTVADEELWSADGYAPGTYCPSPDFVIAMTAKNVSPTIGRSSASRPGCVILDAHTGQVDPRFAEYSGFSTAFFSSDQNWLGVNRHQEFILFELPSGERKWSVSKAVNANLRFSADCQQVTADYAMDEGRVAVARWDVRTGAELAPPPQIVKVTSYGTREVSPDGRFALEAVTLDHPLLRQINKGISKLPFNISVKLPETRKALSLTDAKTSRRIGFVEGATHGAWLMSGSGYYTSQAGRLTVYPAPPVRDWARLIHWIVWPLAGSWLLGQLWSTARTSFRRSLPETPAGEASVAVDASQGG
ncbi:MAG: hypothetical protein KF774_09620 [Planctomyces sp.]|nr:hypothetical protein [Planctomyces sp.]